METETKLKTPKELAEQTARDTNLKITHLHETHRGNIVVEYNNGMKGLILSNPRNRSGKGSHEIQYQIYNEEVPREEVPDNYEHQCGIIGVTLEQDDTYFVDAQHEDADGVAMSTLFPPVSGIEKQEFTKATEARVKALDLFGKMITGEIPNTEKVITSGVPQNTAPVTGSMSEFDFGNWEVSETNEETDGDSFVIYRESHNYSIHVYVSDDLVNDEYFVLEASTEAGLINQGYDTVDTFLAGLDMLMRTIDMFAASHTE